MSIQHLITVHLCPNTGNEYGKRIRHGSVLCEIQYAQGILPLQETGWINLDRNTDTPILHHIPNPDPATFIFRARYVDKKRNYGNFGDPVECTLSVQNKGPATPGRTRPFVPALPFIGIP